MKTNHTLTYSKKNVFPFQITDDLLVTVQEESNPFDLDMNELFCMAARINKNRSFLFVSKLLGKHIPVEPQRALDTGALLAVLYQERVLGVEHSSRSEWIDSVAHHKKNQDRDRSAQMILPQPHLFIGFAETATALGQTVFENFQNAHYIHSTREVLDGVEPTFEFQEEHSHATDQICYGNQELFQNDQPIVLVDDEITTGKTALNIIEALQKTFPRKEYTVLSILDWRSKEHRQRFVDLEERLGITIHVLSLVSGTIEVSGVPNLASKSEEFKHLTEADVRTLKVKPTFPYQSDEYTHAISKEGDRTERSYLTHSGRFGLSSDGQYVLEKSLKRLGTYLSMVSKGTSTLCLGTGEFMYIPMKVASFMGGNVRYQSTTRSPIHALPREGYGVKNAYHYPSPEDKSIPHHFYNIPYKHYDEIFVFLEHGLSGKNDQAFIDQLKRTGASVIYLVDFSS
ncbi:phosphoribosyltransferase family protein [Pontibacillus salipaludis]|uniref:phosphoribosyltransferase family protein n=1 Tax=Pontibacillus salipaludis TaxID=1697394 RepID=UPI0031EF8CB3